VGCGSGDSREREGGEEGGGGGGEVVDVGGDGGGGSGERKEKWERCLESQIIYTNSQ